MRCLTGSLHVQSGQGFTLIELLLVVVLVMLLMGAVIFNFSRLTDNAALDEGATRIETLFRFARAQAANTGRKVQVIFEQASDTDTPVSPVAIRLQWEPDPLERPGEFQDLPEAALQADQVFDLVRIERVALDDGLADSPDDAETVRDEDALLLEELFGAESSPITFFPDGSSDSAELVLVAQDIDPPQRLRLRLNGITGAMFRETLTAEGEEQADAEWEALAAELSDWAEPMTP